MRPNAMMLAIEIANVRERDNARDRDRECARTR
jgi:hypothetical protein